MLKDSTHLVFLLDRSGSMSGSWADTVGGLRTTLDDQKSKPGSLTVSVYSFDDFMETLVDFKNVKEVGDFLENVKPRGMTALYEAFCKSVDETGKKLSALPEALRPERVLFVILTDGGENHSGPAFNLQAVKTRLKHQQDVYKWDFTFLGASFDVAQETRVLGVAPSHNYAFDKADTADNFGKFSRSLTSYRTESLSAKKNIAEYMVEEDEQVANGVLSA